MKRQEYTIPSIVYYIGIKRTDFRFIQLAVNLNEGIQNILITDLHHVIEP